MHLGCRAFSSLQGKTIQAKDDEVDDNDLGQRDGFSKSDIARLKAAYVRDILFLCGDSFLNAMLDFS